jgi:DedD protein
MSNNNLDDLIVDEIPQKSKGKGILAVFALLVAVLIVAIIMTRMIINGDEDNATVVKESTQGDMISSELKLAPSNHDPKADKEELDQLSSILEDELTNKPPKRIIPDTKSSDKVTKSTSNIKPDTAVVDESPIEQKVNEINNVDKDAEDSKTPKQPVATSKPIKRDSVAPQKPKVAKVSSHGRYYIQVGSFSNKPSKQFLSIISKSGFRHKLVGGKLLIGPYGSRSAAQSNLPKVKDRISKGAFIKKL